MTAHTPGPWTTARTTRARTHIHAAAGSDIAQVYRVDYGRREPTPERDANARLIAAAPELLAALREAAPWLGKLIADGGHLQTVMPNHAVRTLEMVEAAIARAEGRAGA